MDMSPISTEKQDDMKPEKSDTDEECKYSVFEHTKSDLATVVHLISVSEIDQGCTIFSGVTYLGASNINSPKSSTEIQRNMAELNSGSASAGLKVSVSIPSNSEGCVM